jgi:hypothetical protein
MFRRLDLCPSSGGEGREITYYDGTVRKTYFLETFRQMTVKDSRRKVGGKFWPELWTATKISVMVATSHLLQNRLWLVQLDRCLNVIR